MCTKSFLSPVIVVPKDNLVCDMQIMIKESKLYSVPSGVQNDNQISASRNQIFKILSEV